jgi:hypothetical protein
LSVSPSAEPRGQLSRPAFAGVPHSQFRDVIESGAPLFRTDVIALETLRLGLRADTFSLFDGGA